jgi:hypothetical protein
VANALTAGDFGWHNNAMISDPKKHRSFVVLIFLGSVTAGVMRKMITRTDNIDWVRPLFDQQAKQGHPEKAKQGHPVRRDKSAKDWR